MSSTLNIAHDPVAIANEFILRGNNDSLMKILKLSYIAHGFKLGMFGFPLSNEHAQAWDFGPVFPGIYKIFKQQPRENDLSLGKDSNNITITSNFGNEEKKIIQFVHDTYSSFKGWQLSALTHKKDTPWEKSYKPKCRNLVILDEDIRNHFKKDIIPNLQS